MEKYSWRGEAEVNNPTKTWLFICIPSYVIGFYMLRKLKVPEIRWKEQFLTSTHVNWLSKCLRGMKVFIIWLKSKLKIGIKKKNNESASHTRRYISHNDFAIDVWVNLFNNFILPLINEIRKIVNYVVLQGERIL